ncbi:MAG: hypothetical protein GY953_48395 [bacterium]|nr:hypothetical protein [bacterium]
MTTPNYLEIARKVLAERRDREESHEFVLKGQAVELWWRGDSLFFVADEEDAALLDEPRGSVYTRAEMEHIITVEDPEIVAEIHQWKREFNGVIRESRKES